MFFALFGWIWICCRKVDIFFAFTNDDESRQTIENILLLSQASEYFHIFYCSSIIYQRRWQILLFLCKSSFYNEVIFTNAQQSNWNSNEWISFEAFIIFRLFLSSNAFKLQHCLWNGKTFTPLEIDSFSVADRG
jgi:hypothetical protein